MTASPCQAPAQVVRESMYVFAAVAPSLGRCAALVLPEANTAMMKLFLQEVSQTFADSFIVLQVDQASWHHSKAVLIPPTIRLMKPPAYSRSASTRWSICGKNSARSTCTIASSPRSSW